MKKSNSFTYNNDPAAQYDVAVIGAGASGMAAALAASENGASVIILDGNDKAGKKLYATGNGRCNFTNKNADGADESIALFRRLGMMSRVEDEGRCYPYSGQAASLVSVIERAVIRAGAVIHLSDRAADVNVTAEHGDYAGVYRHFNIVCDSGASFTTKNVIIATGGRAGLKFGSTGDGYGFAKSFGHTLAAPRPALVAVESEDEFMSALKGVRAKASVTLELNGNVLDKESGEIQFTGTGVSGICVFDLTRFMDAPRPYKNKKNKNRNNKSSITAGVTAGASAAAAAPHEKCAEDKKYMICIDLAPEHDKEALAEFVRGALASDGKRIDAISRDDIARALSGVVNSKLAEVLADIAWIPEDPKKSATRAAYIIKRLKVSAASTKGWDDAQVTVGGVKLDEIDADGVEPTFESKLEQGLFFCGEVLDFDGRCGGYNLQWAWSSGTAAGRAAASRALKQSDR